MLESGRWINLPRARRAAADTINVVQVRKQQRKQQQRCRFNDGSSRCRRSRCKCAPEGHAPAEDGPDVLEPLVAAKLESLVGLMQAELAQQQEQLHQLQFQFRSAQPHRAALATEVQAAEMQAAMAAEMQADVAAEMQAAMAAGVQAAMAAGVQTDMAAEVQAAMAAEMAGLGLQAAVAAEMQAAVAGLEVQAAVAAEMRNGQEQQMGRLRQQQQVLEHSQQQLSLVAYATATQFTQLIHNAVAMSAATQSNQTALDGQQVGLNRWEQQWQSQQQQQQLGLKLRLEHLASKRSTASFAPAQLYCDLLCGCLLFSPPSAPNLGPVPGRDNDFRLHVP